MKFSLKSRLFATLLVLSVFVAGCGSSPDLSKPEGVAEAFFMACVKGDKAGIKKYGKDDAATKGKLMAKGWKDIKVSVTGSSVKAEGKDKVVTLKFKADGAKSDMEFLVKKNKSKKSDVKWVVVDFKK